MFATKNNEVYRVDNVTIAIKSRTTIATYYLPASTGSETTPRCTCTYRASGRTCTHQRDAAAFLASERQAKPALKTAPTSNLDRWIQTQEDDGDVLFA